MNGILCIARQEWRLLRRDRVAVLGLAVLLLLSAVAAFTVWDQHRITRAERSGDQRQAHQAFDAQPDRHPHRMVHYGHFVFRPPAALAAFDPGVDAYTGHTLYLEGHRQNSANFGEVRQSSLLLRFGQLTPAFVLQVLAPLLLVFVGHAAVARERQSGMLRMLLVQGVPAGRIVAGKVLALAAMAALVLLPAWLALAVFAGDAAAQAVPAVLMAIGYALWLLLWVLGIVLVSALARRSHDALVALLAIWVVSVVLMPRFAAEAAASAVPLATRFETDIAVSRELAALGDSHNPDDPYFADFRRRLLAEHGVDRIEDLPLNYKGLLGMEGERLTSELFQRHAQRDFERQRAQLRRADEFALLSPVIAVRRLSMALAGTDLHAYRHFLEQAEQHRYRMVQALNRLQAEQLSYKDDRSSRDDHISRSHWQGLAEFRFEPPPLRKALESAAPAFAVLLACLAALAVALVPAARKLEGAR